MTTAIRTADDNLSGAIAFKGVDNITLKTTGPELLGVPKAPTPVAGDNTTQVATTAFVNAAVQAAGGVVAGNATPLAPSATPVPGVSLAYAREDHVHPVQNALTTTFTPSGTVSSTNVQAAISEVANESVQKTGDTMTGTLNITGSDVSINATSSNTKVQIGGVNGCIEIQAATPFIDMKNSTAEDYDWRISNPAGGDFSVANTAGKYINVKPDGTFEAWGYRGKAGYSSGAWQTNKWNMFWSGSAMQLWVDDTNVGNISVTSDERVKQNVTPVNAPFTAQSAFEQLQVVQYRYKDISVFQDDGITRYGFIAQDVKALFPSVVFGDENDPYSVLNLDPLQLIAILTVELQSALQRITALENA